MKGFQEFYRQLNEEQKEAVDIIDGPLLVLAGPGTGKTQLLSVRAANIIRKKKARAENILILTYTNAAAKTMKDRLARIIGIDGYDVQVGTFHAFANSIILDSEEAANYIQDRIQITEIERVKAIEYILDHTPGLSDIRPFRAPYTYVRDIGARISELKREGVTPGDFLDYVRKLTPDGVYILEKHIPRIKALAVVYDRYEKLKEGKNKEVFDSRGRYDFDDMIIFAIEALSKEKYLREKYEGQFTYIMVDEFQDTNGAQLKLLFLLSKGKAPNLCCVGDDDQSIYRFQGASIANFKELERRFGETLKTVSLKKNYRSSQEIISIAGGIISAVPEEERTESKRLVPVRDFEHKSIEFYEFGSQEEELCFIAERVNEFEARIRKSDELTAEERAHPYNNIAVLIRKRSLIPLIVDKFLQAGIPYATDGKEDIGGEPRVRQMLDIIKFASLEPEAFGERDRLLYKILVSDYLQIPHKEILKLIEKVNRKKKRDREITILQEFLSDTKNKSFVKARIAIKRLLKDCLFKPAHSVLMQYITDVNLYRYILDRYDRDEVIRIRELRGLAAFINMVKEEDLARPGLTIRELMEEIDTRNEHGMPLEGRLVTMTQNGVRIFTAHGSKGQEFHSVIIPFCIQDKSWPIKPTADRIPLPPAILKTGCRAEKKERLKELQLYDEMRLFYVAISRAKSNVLFTASPRENEISSSFLYHIGIKSRDIHQDEEEVIAEFLKKTHKEDPFIGTEEVLRDLVEDMPLNPTSLNNYLRCRRKFLYNNVLLLPGPKRQSLVFGNAVHSALEHLYREFMATGRFPSFRFFRDRFLESLRFQGIEKSMEMRCVEEFENLRKYFNIISMNPVRPLGLENRMPVNINGVIFTGKYDKVEIEDEENGLVRVVDYKTGQVAEHLSGLFRVRSLRDEGCDEYLRQLVCYKLLYERDSMRRHRDTTVSHGVLAFVEPSKRSVVTYNIKKGEPAEIKIEISDEMVDEMVGIIKDVWEDIQALRFEKLPERDPAKCRYCDFEDICWG